MAPLPLQSNYFSSERLKLWGVEDDLNMFFDTRKFYMKSTYTNNIKKYRNKSAKFQGFLFG